MHQAAQFLVEEEAALNSQSVKGSGREHPESLIGVSHVGFHLNVKQILVGNARGAIWRPCSLWGAPWQQGVNAFLIEAVAQQLRFPAPLS